LAHLIINSSTFFKALKQTVISAESVERQSRSTGVWRDLL